MGMCVTTVWFLHFIYNCLLYFEKNPKEISDNLKNGKFETRISLRIGNPFDYCLAKNVTDETSIICKNTALIVWFFSTFN